MAFLGWALNLGFAGGTAAVETTLPISETLRRATPSTDGLLRRQSSSDETLRRAVDTTASTLRRS